MLKLLPHPKFAAMIALGAMCAAGSSAAPAQAGAPRSVPASQQLVVLDRTHVAFSRADSHSPRVGTIGSLRPLTAARTVLPVLRHARASDGQAWLRVMLPGRPNSHAGWILARSSHRATTSWRVFVDTSDRRVTVFYRGRVARTFHAVVGKRSTPTPSGRFFVEETVRLSSNLVGAPFALALSARSNVLAHFDGGPGQIALHGLGNVGGTPGTAASHGCVRLDYRSIGWLASRIGPGVPVTITG
jgi:lipoprotein-anchoring transpeptidase ErfK/SrfK